MRLSFKQLIVTCLLAGAQAGCDSHSTETFVHDAAVPIDASATVDATFIDAGVAVDAALTCDDTLVACGGVCVDTESDLNHCGTCGNACASGDVCVVGACECPSATPNACTAGATARFDDPYAVTVDASGNLYVADGFNSTVRKIVVATGQVTTLAGLAASTGSADGTGSAARFGYPLVGVAADESGNVYISDQSYATIRKLVVATGVVTTFAGAPGMQGSADGTGTNARFAGVAKITIDAAGNLFAADAPAATIRKIDTATAIVTTIAGSYQVGGTADGIGTAARLEYPQQAIADNLGNLFIADTFNNSVRKLVLATGVVTTIAGTAGQAGSADGTGTGASFYHPWNLAIDNGGNMYVADLGNSTVRKLVLATGVVTTIAGTAGQGGTGDGIGTNARFSNIQGVVFDGNGNLFIADTANDTIRKLVVATNAVTTFAGAATVAGHRDSATTASSYCANLQTDNSNCGACGDTCAVGETCTSGACQ